MGPLSSRICRSAGSPSLTLPDSLTIFLGTNWAPDSNSSSTAPRRCWLRRAPNRATHDICRADRHVLMRNPFLPNDSNGSSLACQKISAACHSTSPHNHDCIEFWARHWDTAQDDHTFTAWKLHLDRAARFHGSRLLLQNGKVQGVSPKPRPLQLRFLELPMISIATFRHKQCTLFSQGSVVKRDHGIASRTLNSHVL